MSASSRLYTFIVRNNIFFVYIFLIKKYPFKQNIKIYFFSSKLLNMFI